MDDFDRVVLDLVGEFGATATYVKTTQGTYTPGVGLTNSTTEYPVEAILLDLTLSSNGLSTKYGTQIIAGDKELHIRPPRELGIELDVNPASDYVIVGGTKYKIVTSKEVNPTGEQAILISLYIRR